MSVGAVPNIYAGVPGLTTLGLGTTPSSSTTTTPTTPATTTTPASTGSTVVGFSVLGIQGNGQSTTPAPSTAANPYQTAYDGIVTAANNYLQNSLLNGPGNIPLYTDGQSVNAFSGLSTTLAAISTGLQNGQFQGTGFNSLA